MKTIYRCDFCGKEYNTINDCLDCEESHLEGVEKTKYLLMRNPGICLCDYCAYSYYVYGCERDCEHKKCNWRNNYVDFKPVEPLHNKRITGC